MPPTLLLTLKQSAQSWAVYHNKPLPELHHVGLDAAVVNTSSTFNNYGVCMNISK